MLNMPYSDYEISLYAVEFHTRGKTFKQIGHEHQRNPKVLAKHVWRYLRKRNYQL